MPRLPHATYFKASTLPSVPDMSRRRAHDVSSLTLLKEDVFCAAMGHDRLCRAGQNLADASKLGYVELDTGRNGGPKKTARRGVSLEGHVLNYVLQQDPCAANRQRARTLMPSDPLVNCLPWGVCMLIAGHDLLCMQYPCMSSHHPVYHLV